MPAVGSVLLRQFSDGHWTRSMGTARFYEMRGPQVFSVLLLFNIGLLSGQERATSQIVIGSGGSSVSDSVSENLARDVDASYYHPDALSGIACKVVVDFERLLKQLQSSSETAKLNNVAISVAAMRGQSPTINVSWPNPAPAGQQPIESGVKQMLGGFFQMYWQFAGSSLAPRPDEKFETGLLPGGGHIFRSRGRNEDFTLAVNSEDTPTEGLLDGTALKARFRFRFSPAPNPIPGDLRRLTSLEFAEQIGTTTVNGSISMDYQTVDGLHIPRHVSFGIGGAYSVDIEFQQCTVTKRARAQD